MALVERERIEAGGMLVGAIGLLVLVLGLFLAPEWGSVNGKTAFILTSLSIIGSTLMAGGIALFVLARLRVD